jgi:hypothetical protein
MLKVGDVEFTGLAAPESFQLGGEQKLPIKDLPGGSIIYQPRGYFFNTEQSWEGIFEGVNALNNALKLQKYAQKFDSQPVTFGPFALRFYVERFYFKWVREDWVNFTIRLRRDLDPETTKVVKGPIESKILSTPASSMGARQRIHVVISGESLWKIAQNFKTTVDALYAANKKVIGPNPNIIRPGMRLVIP